MKCRIGCQAGQKSCVRFSYFSKVLFFRWNIPEVAELLELLSREMPKRRILGLNFSRKNDLFSKICQNLSVKNLRVFSKKREAFTPKQSDK